MTDPHFADPPTDKALLEAGEILSPRFDRDGLVTCVVTDAETGAVVMVAHMNGEALKRTIETGVATFWSRSRQAIWVKGETSGNVLSVVDLRIDCDQDAVWLTARLQGDGVACHTGRYSCFYRRIPVGGSAETVRLVTDDPPSSKR